jgi:hypothetical protein
MNPDGPKISFEIFSSLTFEERSKVLFILIVLTNYPDSEERSKVLLILIVLTNYPDSEEGLRIHQNREEEKKISGEITAGYADQVILHQIFHEYFLPGLHPAGDTV